MGLGDHTAATIFVESLSEANTEEAEVGEEVRPSSAGTVSAPESVPVPCSSMSRELAPALVAPTASGMLLSLLPHYLSSL